MAKIILDYIEGINFDSDFSPIPNPHALRYLSHGLCTLADYVRREEVEIIEKYKKRGTRPPLFITWSQEINLNLHSVFNWYATDLVNFTRLIGLIEGLQTYRLNYKDISQDKDIRIKLNEHCTNYIQRVHPEIILWRNKVSAHFAFAVPHKEDNLATLEASVMFPVSYSRPYYEAGGVKWVLGQDESQLPNWKLTKLFEEIGPRYWPDIKISEFPSYQ